MNALEIKNLCKAYKKSNFKLDNINIEVPQGMIVGFVGRNGVGKSTTINSMFDIVKKDSGEILFYGQSLEDKRLKKEIGVVFDTLAYSGEVNIIRLKKVLNDLYENFDMVLFNKYVERFKLPTKQKLKTFSRGMTMQLSIAVALSHGAKLLILDEATAGLDPIKREEMLDLFIDFTSNTENAIFMSSHISSDLEKVADYIYFIDNGKIILSDFKDNLLYEYGIVRIKEKELESIDSSDYIAYRKRGQQINMLVTDKKEFKKKHPDYIIDNVILDEILPILVKGGE